MTPIIFENNFWLQIVGDHLRFFKSTLAIDERDTIETVVQNQQFADQLLELSRQNQDVSTQALKLALTVRQLKLNILNRQLTSNIKINLPPTFINHTINEIDEYIELLNYYQNTGQIISKHQNDYHLLWLPDAAGHADAVITTLDNTEKLTRKQFKKLKKEFEVFYLKAIEYTGYMRTGNTNFPAFINLNNNVDISITLFINMLHELEVNQLNKSILGTLLPLMADHMAREECYYLSKLGFNNTCDPTTPRISD